MQFQPFHPVTRKKYPVSYPISSYLGVYVFDGGLVVGAGGSFKAHNVVAQIKKLREDTVWANPAK